MSQVSTELWRKPETVPLSKFPPSCHASIRKGIQVIQGEIADDSNDFFTNEHKEEIPTTFSKEEMDILRERLGVQLVHGDHTLEELKKIVSTEQETQGHSFKKGRQLDF